MSSARVKIPWIPDGTAVPAELPEEAVLRKLYEQKNTLLLEAHVAARREKALLAADEVREEVKKMAAVPVA